MNWLRKFMIGRYGSDQLSVGLLFLWMALSILSMYVRSQVLEVIKMIIPFIALFRMFSRNIQKRYQENLKFLRYWNPVRNKANSIIQRIKGSKHYRYFKCSNCKQTLRVPKGKGKVAITCPKCKTKMIKRS